MGRSRWFKSDVAGPSGESAVLNAAQTLAVMEARIAETLAHSLTNETEDAGRTLGVYWREAMAQGRHNALGETLHRVSVSNGAEALAALLGLGLSGRRGTALLTAEDLLRARGTLVATAAQGVPLVLHALLHPQGTTGAHDAWHALEGSGWMQFLAPDAQGVADLAVVARRCAEEVLLPALVGQDVWSSGCMEPVRLPEESMVRSFLGRPGEHIPVPTPAQGLVFGEERRRLPQRWSVDHPAGGALETPAGVTSRAAAARAVYLMEDLEGHIARVMAGYATLTGHPLQPVHMMHNDSADWLVLTLGAATGSVLAAAQALGEKGFKGKRVGVAALVQWRPFPARRVAELLAGRKGVLIVEPAGGFPDQDGPVLREVRSALHGCLENGLARRGALPYPGLPALTRLPSLYSALTPAGGEGVSPRAVAAAILAMQNGVGAPRRVFLEVPFLWERPETPKEELLQQALLDTYPHAGRQGLSASEALPATPGLLTVRILARQGHTPFFPGEHPAAMLAELSGLQVKAWRQPAGLMGVLGSGTLETSWLLACPRSPVSPAQAKTLSANALPEAVDLLLCADAAALTAPGILAGLKPQGTILAQGTPAESAALWASLPPPVKHALVSGQARLLLVDAETPVRAEAIAPEEQRQLSGRVWLGALLALPEVAALTGLSGKPLQRALRSVLTPLHEDVHEEGQGHGQTAVDAHLALIEAGLSACIPLSIPQEGPAGTSQPSQGFSRPSQSPASLVPEVLKHRASGTVPALDLHRFWETLVEPMAARGVASLLAEPFLTSGLSPASGGLLTTQYLAGVAFPRWVPERCTGCGACWTLCPDGALPARVNPPGEVLQMAQARLKSQGGTAEHLLRALRQMEGHWRDLIVAAGTGHEAGALLDEAAARTLAGSRLTGEDKKALEGELAPLLRMLRPLKLAVTAPFFSAPETAARNSGGLLSLVLDPDRCTGCGACVAACAEQALGTAPLLEADLGVQRDARDIQRRLPDTPMPFLTAPQAGETPGLERLLLSIRAQETLVGGALSHPGATERTALRLFTAMVEAALRPRVAVHLERIETLIASLEKHIRLRLAVDVEDPEALRAAMAGLTGREFTLADLSARVDRDQTPLDSAWLERVTGLLSGLKGLRDLYRPTGAEGAFQSTPRTALGLVGLTEPGCAWRPAWPFNPYPFPWTDLPVAEGPALALGVFEGHMARMAEGFRLIRMTGLELEDRYNDEVHGPFFSRFCWRHFTEEELRLCPPVILAGGDSLLTGAAQGALAGLLAGGRPVKVLLLDGRTWRTLSESPGKDSRTSPGTPENTPPGIVPTGGNTSASAVLPVPGPWSPALGDVFLLQGGLGDVPHLLQGFLDGLASPRPALFCVYAANLSRHDAGSAMGAEQSAWALRSRAHPALRYDPDAGSTPHERLSLAGNPEPEALWPLRVVESLDTEGHKTRTELPLTFADYAATLPGLARHFTPLTVEEGERATPMADYLDLDPDARAETCPFVSVVDARGSLRRLEVSPAVAQACEARRNHWRHLRALTREDQVPVDTDGIAGQARLEVVDVVWRSLMELARPGEAMSPAALEALARPADADGTTGSGGD